MPTERGPLEVFVCPDAHEIEVVVRDEGTGIQPRAPEREAAMQGVGLSLIQALTEKVEFGGGADQGTEVRMTFHSERALDAERRARRPRRRAGTTPPATPWSRPRASLWPRCWAA